MAARLPVALLALTAALAGCLGPLGPGLPLDPAGLAGGPTSAVAHGLDGAPAPLGRALALPPTAGLQLSIGARSFEPTVGVTADGTLFITAFRDNPTPAAIGVPLLRSAPTVMRSLDEGRTWEDVGPVLPTGDGNPPLTNDPYVYVDPATGRVFMLDLYALVCSWLSWSDDLGATWATNPLACGTPGGNDHQSIVAATPLGVGTQGYPNVVVYCVNRVADSACARSVDGGATFAPLVTVFPGLDQGELCGGLTGHVKAAPDGRLLLPKGHCGVAEVALSDDSGATWTRSVISGDVPAYGHEVAVAVDEAGHTYALWIRTDGLPYLAVSRDGGSTWDPARSVAPPGVTATEFPALAAGAPGKVALAYVGTTIAGGYEGRSTGGECDVDLVVVGLICQPSDDWEGATWNAYLGVLTDALAEDPVVLTVTANDPADPVARDVCGRTRCSGIGDFIDIVIDPAGRPWASFVDVCGEACAQDPEAGNDQAIGFVGTLRAGPALRGAGAQLAPLAAP